MSLFIDLTQFTKIIWIIDLNVKCKSIKLLEDNIGKNVDDLGFGDALLNKHQRHDPYKNN